jgi:hypothetical protein
MKTLHFRAHLDMENRPLTFGYLYTGAATCTTARRPKPTRCSRLRNDWPRLWAKTNAAMYQHISRNLVFELFRPRNRVSERAYPPVPVYSSM